MDYNSATKQRFKEMHAGADGKLMADWQLTDTKLLDTVKLTLPPAHSVPIIFVPGIMGSNLSDKNNKPIWLLNSVSSVPVGLAWKWSRKNAAERQKFLHPQRTQVFTGGAVPKDNVVPGLTQEQLLNRGWGQISEASYHEFLIWLNEKMNGNRDPMAWSDFSEASTPTNMKMSAKQRKMFPPGLCLHMNGLPDTAESIYKVNPIKSDELLSRSKSSYPIYAFGYNWLDGNGSAAKILRDRIKEIIKENNRGFIKCSQVILVTHSMGGLVARECSRIPEMEKTIVGVVHGVMPAVGAAVAYRRCKVGMKDEDMVAGLVIGSNGQEVTAVFAQSPGALQLLPSESYGKNWLQITDATGRIISSYPSSDPYEEIYLRRDRWWSLINEEWLTPFDGCPIQWDEYEKNIRRAKDFHRGLEGKFHQKTFSFYGGGEEKRSYEKVVWTIKKTSAVNGQKIPTLEEVANFSSKNLRIDGSNILYFGGRVDVSNFLGGEAGMVNFSQSSFWEIRCSTWNSSGDGTVPKSSGCAPRRMGKNSILQQFELSGVMHEPAFRDYPTAKTVSYYAITKLAALANRE